MIPVSVIIPNYNHARYLRRRIDSVLDQTYRDFELIILDDCSTDGSRAVIDEYAARGAQISVYYNGANSGSPFRQWDFGVSRAGGEFVWIAESDDVAEPDFLERAAPLLKNNGSLGLVYCDARILDGCACGAGRASDLKRNLHGSKWLRDYTNSGEREIFDHLYLHNTINNASGVLFRKSTYARAGWADRGMRYCGDWFLYARMLRISDIAYIASPLNNLRLHAASALHDYYTDPRYFRELVRVYLFMLATFSLPPRKKLCMARHLCAFAARKAAYGIGRKLSGEREKRNEVSAAGREPACSGLSNTSDSLNADA